MTGHSGTGLMGPGWAAPASDWTLVITQGSMVMEKAVVRSARTVPAVFSCSSSESKSSSFILERKEMLFKLLDWDDGGRTVKVIHLHSGWTLGFLA